MRRFFYIAPILAGAAIALAACDHQSKAYTLTGKVDTRYNDAKVLLISLVNGDTIRETAVEEGVFAIPGEIEQPVLAQIRIGGRAAGNVVLEPGEILFTPEGVSGTPLNETLNQIRLNQAELFRQIREIPDSLENAEQLAQALYDNYNAYEDSVMKANLDNPVGASLFIDAAYELELPEIDSVVAQHPALADYSKLQQIIDNKKIQAETSEGRPYKDFEVEYNGTATKLSDLMKPDRYTLVDFWASWCGPCRREIPVIKEILEEYGPKGLDVVGVAVWDEPAETEKAIEELDITWPVIINAQRIPTDIYGILGIPTIILIGPDGTILSRGKQDEELKAAVAAAMAQ